MTDRSLAYVHKSDERPEWGEWWDLGRHPALGRLIGHAADASTGLYLTPDGRESISAQDAVRRGLDYGRLELSGYYFEDAVDGGELGRLWLMDEIREPIEIRYTASIVWRDGRRERTPVRIRLRPGRGIYRGVEVSLEQEYDPRRVDASNPRRLAGFLEVNHYTVSAADRFWVRHAYYQDDAEGRRVLRGIAQLEEQVSARGRLAGLRAAGVRILDAPLPRHRLLSDDALEAA